MTLRAALILRVATLGAFLGLMALIPPASQAASSAYAYPVELSKREIRQQKRLDKLVDRIEKRLDKKKGDKHAGQKAFRDVDRNLRLSLILFGIAVGLAIFWAIIGWTAFFSFLVLGFLIAAIVFLLIWVFKVS